MIPSLEGWPTKAKEAPFPHEVRLTPLDTNPVFQSFGEINQESCSHVPFDTDTSKTISKNFYGLLFKSFTDCQESVTHVRK